MSISLRSIWTVALRDAVMATVVVLLVSVVTGYVVYQSAEAGMKRQVQNGLLSIAKSAAELTDGDAHQQITQPEQLGSLLYEHVREPYFKLLKANPDVTFIYTAIEKEDGVYFIMDSKLFKPGEKVEYTDVMTKYDDATAMMLRSFKEQKALVEDEAYSDDWGTFLSGYAPIYNSKHEFLGIVGADMQVNDYLDQLNKVKKSLMIGVLVAAVASLFAGVGVWFVRSAALKMAAQHKEQQVQMEVIKQKQTEEQKRQKAESEEQRKTALQNMASHFEESVQGVIAQLVDASSHMHNDSEDMAHIADDTKNRSHTVAEAAKTAADTSAHISNAAGEMQAAINEISSQVQKSSHIAQDASGQAEQAKQAIEALSTQSNKVGEIVQVINNISSQINLLALNATIESARAGEAGRGFTVVANEVKQLAGQVNRATDEISTQIDEMRVATRYSVESVLSIIQIINEVSTSIQAVAAAVEEQSAVTHEIVRNIGVTALGAQDISANIIGVQEGAERTGKTATGVVQLAKALNNQSQILQQKVKEFLQTVNMSS